MKTLDEHLTAADLKKLIHTLPGHVCWKDLNGRYMGCNQAFADTLNLPNPTAINGMTDFDILDKRRAQQIFDNDQQVMKEKIKKDFIENAIDKNGNVAIYYSKKVPYYNEQKKVVGLICVAIDISEINSKMQKLEQESGSKSDYINKMTYLNHIANLFPGNMYWKGLDGVYLGCNENQNKDFTGLVSTIIGKTLFDLMPDDEAMIIDQTDRELMKSGEAKIIQELVIDEAGNELTYLSSKMPLYDEVRNVVGMLGMSMDISERIEMEASLKKAKLMAEEASKTKNNFIMNMSHDLRTPFNGIIGFSEALLQTDQTKENKQMLKNISQSATRLLRIIDDLIDLVTSDSHEEDRVRFSVKSVLNELTQLLKPRADFKGIDLTMNISEDIPRFVYGNKFSVNRVLLNLLSNAIKFTNDGYVKLTAELLKSAKDKDTRIRFIVEDSGIGIAKNQQSKIFEKFHRSPTAKKRFEGNGLGLYFVKLLVEQMNGSIDLESAVNQGTQFVVEIPFSTGSGRIR